MTIRQLLEQKGRTVYTIGPDESVFEAIRRMAEKGIGALVVTEGETPVGIVTERDYARKVILKGRSSKETPVREIMSSPVIFVRPEQTIEEAMGLMTEKKIRHLPVEEDGRLAGIISIGDVVKAIIENQKFTIEQLTSYIQGASG